MKNEFRQTSQTSYLKVIFKLYLKFSALTHDLLAPHGGKISSLSVDAATLFILLGQFKLLPRQNLKLSGHCRLNLGRRGSLRRCLNLRPIKTITIKASVLHGAVDDAS
nr:hypothetical protein [uncultured Campylobacter sp.]